MKDREMLDELEGLREKTVNEPDDDMIHAARLEAHAVTNLPRLLELARKGLEGEWISVEEALPKLGEPVLVVHEEGYENPVWIAWRVGGEPGKEDPVNWAWSSYQLEFFPPCLYWMPLPDPPKEKDNG